MNVLVFRNRFGAVAAWALPPEATEEAPDVAYLSVPGIPRDPRLQNMDSRGSGQTWDQWAEYLASQPLLGNWRIQELPDGTDADDALTIARRQDVLASAYRRTLPELPGT